MTIVIVSHELSVIGGICDHVAVIEDGSVAETFALDDAGSLAQPRRTALGRELAQHRAVNAAVNTGPHGAHNWESNAESNAANHTAQRAGSPALPPSAAQGVVPGGARQEAANV